MLECNKSTISASTPKETTLHPAVAADPNANRLIDEGGQSLETRLSTIQPWRHYPLTYDEKTSLLVRLKVVSLILARCIFTNTHGSRTGADRVKVVEMSCNATRAFNHMVVIIVVNRVACADNVVGRKKSKQKRDDDELLESVPDVDLVIRCTLGGLVA